MQRSIRQNCDICKKVEVINKINTKDNKIILGQIKIKNFQGAYFSKTNSHKRLSDFSILKAPTITMYLLINCYFS